MQVAGTVNDVEQLQRPVDCATIGSTCAHGWYKLHAGPIGCPPDKGGGDRTTTGERLEAMGDNATAWLCRDRVCRTRSSGSESHGERLTDSHYSLRIPRRGALEPVPVRL